MAGDRARVSYDPSRKWRGVVAQQGRVTVEADWNEAATIDAERDRRLTLDVVGTTGTPDGGYVVTAVPATGSPPEPTGSPPVSTPGDLTIGPGTLYLGGQRLDLDAPVSYSTQPDWLDYSTDPLWAPPAVPASAGTSYELVYLLASEQEVSAVEDPALADVALGGPDTMQRQRILQRFVRKPIQSGTCHESWSGLVSSLGSEGLQFDAASMMIGSTTTLQVSFPSIPAAPDPCQPVATGGYLGAENQMIRVMVTRADTSGAPTIVWGFDDASFLYRVVQATYDPISRNATLTLASAPVDSFHFPAAGQAVELLRDAVRLNETQPFDYIASPTGFVSMLTEAYDPTTRTLVISGEPPGGYPEHYFSADETPQLYLRVWQAAVPAPAGEATTLDGTGVAVTLTSSTGSFHAGDFWRFALRPIQPTIVYPDRYLVAPQPPDGPRTWACPLAVLTWDDGSATASGCVPPFASLAELTATKGGCCTVDVRPSDVDDGALLQALLDGYATQGPITVCLEPGTYTLPAPLMLGPELDGITLQACRPGVVLQAPSQPGAGFVPGLIAIQDVTVTIRGIELSVPLAEFSPPDSPFASMPPNNQILLEAFSTGLQVAIGISVDDSADLTVEDCTFTFEFPDAGTANVFGAGIFATGAMDGTKITRCAFQSANPPTTVPFNDLAVTPVVNNQLGAPPPYQLTFGYLQLPGASAAARGSTTQLLHDATIEQSLFQGVTIPALVMAQLGTLRVDSNTVRNAYGGFWFVSADPQTVIFDQFSVGDPVLYSEFASAGIAALRDGIFVIATAIARVLLTAPPAGGPVAAGGIPAPTTAQLTLTRQTLSAFYAQVTGPAGAPAELPPGIDAVFTNLGAPAPAPSAAIRPAAIPVADTGTSVSLRLDLCDCQVDAIIADSYSGAGLLVVDFMTDAGSALLHGNRIRSRFPMGETALVGGVGEACVTGNVVANEVPPQSLFNDYPNALPSCSMVLNPATTTPLGALGAVLDPSSALLGNLAAVAVTGNVFISPTSLPGRPVTIPSPLADWDVLNTVIDYGGAALPAVIGVSPKSGPGATPVTVTVTGSGFTGATSVSFGTSPGSNLNVVSDTALTVDSPAGSGTVHVTVTTPGGISLAGPADQFTYLGVTGVSPPSGPLGGRTPVTVTGSGFTGATSVSFGTSPGSNLNVVSDAELTVDSPPGSGTVDVTVTTPEGTSPVVPADQFHYRTT